MRAKQASRTREKTGLGRRARTIAGRCLSADERAAGETLAIPADVVRPRVRGDCAGGPRPCPWVSCEHHLYLDTSRITGSIKLNFPGKEVDELVESCVLDVADRGGVTLQEVGRLINLTRERVRQLEVRGLVALRPLVNE